MKHLSKSIVALLACAWLAGCAGDEGDSGSVSQVDLQVTVDNSDVTSVEFEVDCEGGFALEGNLNVVDDRDPPVWATIMDLPVGECTITLTARDDAGAVLCAGSEDVTVVENETTKVAIVLTCEIDGNDPVGNVEVDATFEEVDGNRCPRLQLLNAVPNEIPAGGSSEVTVLVSDPDGDPLTTTLTATSGSFADPAAQSTTYTCGASGTQTIRVVASDGDVSCDKTKTFAVACGGSGIRPLPEIYTTGSAINYSAFRRGGPGAGELPSDQEVFEDLTLLRTAGYNLLRLFGADAVSEKILRIAAESFPEMQFQQGLFLEGLPNDLCESEINDSQVATAIRLANTYDSVVTVSVGNETSFFAPFMPLPCLEGYISQTRAGVTQPVTADDDYTFYANVFGRSPDTVLRLIDFAAIHMYPITNYRQWDWRQTGVPAGPLRAEAMMNASLAKAQQNYQRVYDYEYTNVAGQTVTIGESLPIVIGETGWKWRQTAFQQEIEFYAARQANAKWYYDLMLGWERSPGGPPTIFIFVSFDEAWKTTDDGWGFWDEFRQPLYVLCGTPAGSACNDPLYEGAGFFTP